MVRWVVFFISGCAIIIVGFLVVLVPPETFGLASEEGQALLPMHTIVLGVTTGAGIWVATRGMNLTPRGEKAVLGGLICVIILTAFNFFSTL